MKWFKLSAVGLALLAGVVVFRAWDVKPAVLPPDLSFKTPTVNFDEDKAIQRFAKMLTFKTISTGAKQENNQAAFADLHRYIRANYPDVFSTMQQIKLEKNALLLKWQGSDNTLPPVLYMAHLDVVPIAPGTETAWSHEPFAGDITDGFVWGRGALDCKSLATALLETANLLIKNHVKPTRTIYFYLGDDEEISGGSASSTAKLLEKQGVHLEAVFDEGGVITDSLNSRLEKPVALISIAEKGMLNLELTATAQGGHSSMPTKDLAIGSVSQAVVNVLKHPFSPHLDSVNRALLDTISVDMPFSSRIFLRNIWLFKPVILSMFESKPLTNALVRTTQAPTIIQGGIKANVLPSNATALINLRLSPGDTIESATQHVRDAIDNPNVTVTQKFGINASSVSSMNSKAYEMLTRAIKYQFGQDVIVAPWILVGGTDAKFFASVSDNVYRFSPERIGKDDMSRYHGVNERIATKDYVDMIKFYYVSVYNSALTN